MTEQEMYRPSFNRGDDGSHQRNNESKEFVVKGAPWEQQAPNTDSVKDFPTFGKQQDGATEFTSSPIAGAWGQRL